MIYDNWKSENNFTAFWYENMVQISLKCSNRQNKAYGDENVECPKSQDLGDRGPLGGG